MFTDPVSPTWLNLLIVGFLFGFAFTLGAAFANWILGLARRGTAP